MNFEFFDKDGELNISRGKLPHWYQPGVTYFVTFRTEDSVPDDLARAWHAERQAWLRWHEIDPSARDCEMQLKHVPDAEREYHARFTRRFMEYLDRGLGECVLRDPRLAQIVGDGLRSFDGIRYHLGDFVVMPNHVHALLCLIGASRIEAICSSWKHFTAREINRLLVRRGRFWQEESFDHLVRGPTQFRRFQQYIGDNPVKAKLPAGNFLLHSLGR